MSADMFPHEVYLLRRKVFKLLGGAFHIYAPDGTLAAYSQQKAFKLKEEVRIFADEAMTRPLLLIKARSVLDFSATYDVTDARDGARIGGFRRKGMKSIVSDEWTLLDAAEREIGSIREDNLALALLRRLVAGAWLPQTYHGTMGDRPVCNFHRNFNPFVSKVTLDFRPDASRLLDRRLGIAAGILLLAIEGKQD